MPKGLVRLKVLKGLFVEGVEHPGVDGKNGLLSLPLFLASKTAGDFILDEELDELVECISEVLLLANGATGVVALGFALEGVDSKLTSFHRDFYLPSHLVIYCMQHI